MNTKKVRIARRNFRIISNAYRKLTVTKCAQAHLSIVFDRDNGGSSVSKAVADGNLGRPAIVMLATASALTASAAMTAQVDCVFIGKDDGDVNLSIYSNDSSGRATKTDLGASFPGNTASADMYETRSRCAPDGSVFYWSIENLVTGAFAEGSLSSDIPAGTTLLSPQIFGSTGTSTVAMGIDVVSQYIETDY